MRETRLSKILMGALWKHSLRTLATLAAVILSLVLAILPPLVLAQAVDALAAGRQVSMHLAAEYFTLLACSGAADACREAMIVATGENLTHALRSSMMEKLHHLPAAYFTEHEAGQTSSLLVNDVDAIEEMFSSGIISMMSDLGTVIAILIVVFDKSRGLGVLLLIALPLLSLFTYHVQKKMLAAHLENRRAAADASGILPETLHIIRSLHVYHAESFAEEKYDAVIQNSFQAVEKTNYYDAVYSPVIMTVSAAVIAVMMSLSGQSGAFRAWFGMSVGTAVAVIAYVNKIFTPLSSIGMEIQTVQSAAAGWKRVQAFLKEEETEPVSCLKTACMEYPVLIQDLSFSYDKDHPVLDHFSLSVEKGEFTTIAGRTGAGKSTLFKLILGLYKPSEGTILINGIRPQEFSEEDRRKTICCVEQKVSIVPGTIRDQITLGNPSYTDKEVWKALDTAGLADTVKAFGQQLDEPYRDALFSQGQKQLIMIARAVVSDPGILLLDEIASGLDSSTEKMVFDALKKASASRTVLSISHRLSEGISGRIVYLGAERVS